MMPAAALLSLSKEYATTEIDSMVHSMRKIEAESQPAPEMLLHGNETVPSFLASRAWGM